MAHLDDDDDDDDDEDDDDPPPPTPPPPPPTELPPEEKEDGRREAGSSPSGGGGRRRTNRGRRRRSVGDAGRRCRRTRRRQTCRWIGDFAWDSCAPLLVLITYYFVQVVCWRLMLRGLSTYRLLPKCISYSGKYFGSRRLTLFNLHPYRTRRQINVDECSPHVKHFMPTFVRHLPKTL